MPREELMTVAMCWELQAKVPAEYAYAHRDLTYFCPEPVCLEEVSASHRKHFFFFARHRHAQGCPNEPESKDETERPGSPKPKPLPVPPPPVPTFLGPLPRPRRRVGKPSKAELLELAQRVKHQPVQQAGTFEEVLNAWASMAPEERALSPLTIREKQYTYETAFQFLKDVHDRDVANLACEERIIFGAARVSAGEKYYFVSSDKTFDHGHLLLHLRLDVKKKNPAPANVPELLGQKVTLFWHGPIPVVAANETAFLLHPRADNPYEGAGVRPGTLIG